ncbi:hypothetical protein H8E77_24480 [bacterium]|nr:hypothetical protein [bacterium]
MFKNRANNTNIMKRFLIIAALSLILLTALGCFNDNNISSPKDSDSEVFAAPAPPPPPEPETYHAEGLIGPNGGTITPGETKAIFPAGALKENVYITVDVEVYDEENKIHYIFAPHGTVFNESVRLEIPWSYLEDYEGPLELWYLDGNEWVLVEDAIIEVENNRFIVYVEHFSEYYFPRR